MELTLFNTLSRKKEVFTPLTEGKVGMYCCGPTVYHYTHIGNLRTYLLSDFLRRVLEFNGFSVNHVMNITDVGHLTSDGDTGDDKMEKGAAREGKTVWDIAKFYTDVFKEDMVSLNTLDPVWVKATDHIKEQIEQIKILEENGHTYKTSDGIYFDTGTIMDYGDLAKLHIQNLEAGARVEMGEKKNKTDFALWKFSPRDSKRQMEWDSKWGVGFPGWHIECSAMSMKHLGNHFDIHIGGTDLIPVHHTNEIAQAQAVLADEKPWVNYWLHGEFIVLDGDERMSKSSGNFLTLAKLEEMGYSPMVYRYFCLTAHYRQQLSFNESAMQSAKNSYERLKNVVAELQREAKEKGSFDTKFLEEFHKAINDDLNMPKALAVLWEFLRNKELSAQDKILTLQEMDEVFGLKLLEQEVLDIPQEVQELANKREEARKNKDWENSDKLRDEIAAKGFVIRDEKEGYTLKKK